MPVLSFKCTSAAPDPCPVFDAFRSVHDDGTPPCPVCGAPSETNWDVWRNDARYAVTPVVVFQAADGSFRFPGAADGLYARKCESEGMTRVELRGWADVRRFEGQVNQQELSKIHRRVERQQAAMAAGEALRRSDLFNGMRNGFQIPETVIGPRGEHVKTGRMKTVHLSARSRDIAARLIENNNNKRVRAHEPGFHIEAYSMDRSNREQGRDERGHRRRD